MLFAPKLWLPAMRYPGFFGAGKRQKGTVPNAMQQTSFHYVVFQRTRNSPVNITQNYLFSIPQFTNRLL